MISSERFFRLNQLIKGARHEESVVIVLEDILAQNCQILKHHLSAGVTHRVVVKSLPSLELLQKIFALQGRQLGPWPMMVFREVLLDECLQKIPHPADYLLGRPCGISAARWIYERHGQKCVDQVTWLIDTEQRWREYLAFAEELLLIGRPLPLKIALEIDVGLHRGGFQDLGVFRKVVAEILDAQIKGAVQLVGLMGYDAHLVKAPRICLKAAFRASQQMYRSYRQVLFDVFPSKLSDQFIFNGAGSFTYQLHGPHGGMDEGSLLNDVSVGSALLFPRDFEVKILKGHSAACFLAVPVLKYRRGVALPLVGKFTRIIGYFFPWAKSSYFMAGGYWKADVCYPKRMRPHPLYGRSSNQEMLCGPVNNDLTVGDYFFYRPRQSEEVLLQFPHILFVGGDGRITGVGSPLLAARARAHVRARSFPFEQK